MGDGSAAGFDSLVTEVAHGGALSCSTTRMPG